jgi:Putative O-methyltransferase
MSRKVSRPINYALRPAKNIQRKMMGEALARLSLITPLPRYRYVGFGSEFFSDFALYHQTLGIDDMISIEGDEAKLERCKFNRPYKCVEVRGGSSKSVLPQLAWKQKRTIVWLDYTEALNTDVLDDIRLVLASVLSGSVLIVTVNVEPSGAPEEDGAKSASNPSELAKQRLQKLVANVGRQRVPSEVTGAQLAKWGLAAASYRIVTGEIETTMNDLNAPQAEDAKWRFRQFLHFRYRDGQRMLTVGGVVVDPTDNARLGEQAFDSLGFARTGEDAMLIEPPMLTGREVRYLNQYLPHEAAEMDQPGWLTAEDRRKYKEVYRYFPIFAESEL